MKKNYKKIPQFIIDKIQELQNSDVIVSTAVALKEDDLKKHPYSAFEIDNVNGQIDFLSQVLFPAETGRYSKKNVNGYSRTRRDLPKISKTYYLGERPVFGDWSRGSFPLNVTKLVFPKDVYPPTNRRIGVEYLGVKSINTVLHHVFKFYVMHTIDKTAENFDADLLFDINLMQEALGTVDVFDAHATANDYINALSVNWLIFPPGERDSDIRRIVGGFRNPTPQVVERLQERYDYLMQFGPMECILGKSGMRGYFGMKFTDNIVVFENMESGHAIYMLFENWEESSKLSRSEIQDLPSGQYVRILHSKHWKDRLARELNDRLPPKAA